MSSPLLPSHIPTQPIRRATLCVGGCCGVYLAINIIGLVLDIALLALKIFLYVSNVETCNHSTASYTICEHAFSLELLAILYFVIACLSHGFGVQFSVLGL